MIYRISVRLLLVVMTDSLCMSLNGFSDTGEFMKVWMMTYLKHERHNFMPQIGHFHPLSSMLLDIAAPFGIEHRNLETL